jgi:uncharacterized small protein (DUF1192 family)
MLVHSKMLRWLARPLLPKGWTAGGFKTSGDLEAQRVSLQTLGNRLAGLGIFSFLCKCVSSATSYFARDVFAPASGNFEAIMFLATTLTVQAIPSAMTLLLLSRFHFSGGGESRGTLMQSLLSREDVALALSSDSAAASSQQAQHAPDVARLQEEIARLKAGEAQKASDNARLQEENARLKAGEAQKASDNTRLQEEIARLRAQMAASQQAK